MGHLVQLRSDGCVNFRHTVAVDVAPQAADAVEIPVAIGVNQMHSLGCGNDQRVVGVPQLVVREWMPDVLPVEIAELVRGHSFSVARLPASAQASTTMVLTRTGFRRGRTKRMIR